MNARKLRCMRLGVAALVAACFAISCWLMAQDPLPVATPQAPTQTPLGSEDDPLLRAIKDRVQWNAPQTAKELGAQEQGGRPRGADYHWRAAELMLRSARFLDRDADAAESQGNLDQAAELRTIATNLRANVVRLLAVHP